MIFGLTLSTIIELVLAGLLATTLICCISLERRLRQLRQDQDKLNATVRSLNAGIAAAAASLAGLRAAAKDADETLGPKVVTARALADELSLLTASGERIASRIETASDRGGPRIIRSGAPKPSEAMRAVR